MKLSLLTITALAVMASQAYAIEECRGRDRAARMVTCVYDADTVWIKGKKLRLLDIDAPETASGQCPRERQIGNQATRRLIALMDGGYRIQYSGRVDRTSAKRQLVRIILPNGEDVADVLLRERLVQVWPNRGNLWCGRP